MVGPCCCGNAGVINAPVPSGGISCVLGKGVGRTEPDEPLAVNKCRCGYVFDEYVFAGDITLG